MATRGVSEPESQWWRVVLIEAIARQAALALHHSRLVERNRLEERRKAILEERNRLARDIHDNLAQGFAAILMQLQAAQREAGSLPPAVASSIETAIELARTHLTEARRSVGALRPNVGSGEDIATALKRLADLASARRACRSTCVVDELPRFGDGVEREIVAIAQEALTNAVRHSRARRITIRASTVQSVGLRLSVADDGRGIAREPSASGFGMTSMQERADRIGASLTIVTAPRSGTEVVLAWEPAVAADAGPCRQLRPPPGCRTRPRVLLVDDHALLRTGVANIINQEPDLHVVAEAGNGVEAIEAYERHQPDVTLLDLRMPVMEGVEVVRRIRERDPARARDRPDDLRHRRRDLARAEGRREGLRAEGHFRRRSRELHPRRARRQDLPRAGRGGQAGRRRDARAAHAARAGHAAAAGRRQGEQGNRQRARHQRAHGEDPPRTSVREARRDEPHRGDQGRDAPRARSPRLGARNWGTGWSRDSAITESQ